MNNQTLVIYDFKILYNVLREIDSYINFNLININQMKDFKLNDQDNYLIISNKKKGDVEDLMIINKFPIEITKLIENINIKFLKKKFNQQSEINLGIYKLNLNSRKNF